MNRREAITFILFEINDDPMFTPELIAAVVALTSKDEIRTVLDSAKKDEQ